MLWPTSLCPKWHGDYLRLGGNPLLLLISRGRNIIFAKIAIWCPVDNEMWNFCEVSNLVLLHGYEVGEQRFHTKRVTWPSRLQWKVGTEKCSKLSANTPIPVQMGQWEDGKQLLLLFDRKCPILCAPMATRQKNFFCYFRPNREFILGSQVRGGSIRMNFSLIARGKNFSFSVQTLTTSPVGSGGWHFSHVNEGGKNFIWKYDFLC